jgi:hypothetical protein
MTNVIAAIINGAFLKRYPPHFSKVLGFLSIHQPIYLLLENTLLV